MPAIKLANLPEYFGSHCYLLALMGGSGVGKGTFCEKFRRFGSYTAQLTITSSGDFFRKACEDPEFPDPEKAKVKSGGLVDDCHVEPLIERFVGAMRVNSINVADGMLRSNRQVTKFCDSVKVRQQKMEPMIVKALYLDAHPDLLRERCAQRLEDAMVRGIVDGIRPPDCCAHARIARRRLCLRRGAEGAE